MDSFPHPPASLQPISALPGPAPAIPFDNTFVRLPERFYARVRPTPVAAPSLIKLNSSLARELGIDPEFLLSAEGIAILAGNLVPANADPIAMAYAGHQFGHFVPQLGDGRANLLGEIVAPSGKRFDIQLKGSGPTPYSRAGDGRAALGPVLREYILSESMAALGVPTTRALAAVTTGESVFRDSVLPGAVFTRVAASHLRVGTFQYFAARHDIEALQLLASYAIARHDPQAAQADHPTLALIEGVIRRQARLVAQWMLIGFVHGVMNTDNSSISGETIDYGPCAFLEAYDPATVFSSIDHGGRYAYGNQPHVAVWNLARLAEALLPVLALELGSEEKALNAANQALATFEPQFNASRSAGLRRKIGLTLELEGDNILAEDLLDRMAANHADFTATFRILSEAASDPTAEETLRNLFASPAVLDEWIARWRARLQKEPQSHHELTAQMRSVNPAFIPRNHRVEGAIHAATHSSDFQPFEALLDALARPFDHRPELDKFQTPARPEERVLHTFCGT